MERRGDQRLGLKQTMLFAPPQLRPVRLRPRDYRPQDRAATGSTSAPHAPRPMRCVATVAPGSSSYTITGAPSGSEAFYYVRAMSRCGVLDVEPLAAKLQRVAFDCARQLHRAGSQRTHRPASHRGRGRSDHRHLGLQRTPRSRRARSLPGLRRHRRRRVRRRRHGRLHRLTQPLDRPRPVHPRHAGHRACVRSVAASGSEETNQVSASAIADAQAPAAPTALSTEITAE